MKMIILLEELKKDHEISVDLKEDILDFVILTTVIDIEKARRNRHY